MIVPIQNLKVCLIKDLDKEFRRYVKSKHSTAPEIFVYPVILIDTEVVNVTTVQPPELTRDEKLVHDEDDNEMLGKKFKQMARKQKQQVINLFFIAHPKTGKFKWVDCTVARKV